MTPMVADFLIERLTAMVMTTLCIRMTILIVFIEISQGLIIAKEASMRIIESESRLSVRFEDRILLEYNKQSPTIPKGIDSVYQRSGFIHPVNTLKGKAITDAFPIDHPHQDGIFSAWVKTTYGERKIDFWNLSARTGSVKHERVVSTFENESSVGFEVDIVHRAEGKEPIDILRERWKVTVFNPERDSYCFDIESLQEAITDIPLVIEKNRYGGMALRGAFRWLKKSDKDMIKVEEKHWTPEPFEFLNSDRQDRVLGNHSPAKWVAMSGKIDLEDVCMAVLGHPQNFRAPQPVRMHETKPYFCFSPCVVDALEISREKPLRARYRYWVSDTSADSVWIDERWNEMASTLR